MRVSKLLRLTLVSSAFVTLVGCGANATDITASSSGEEVYNATCASCHNGGLKGWMTGAPKVGDKETWEPLIVKGVDALTASSIAGFEKMPAKGGCHTCSDEQIKAAVELMVLQSN